MNLTARSLFWQLRLIGSAGNVVSALAKLARCPVTGKAGLSRAEAAETNVGKLYRMPQDGSVSV